MNKTGQNIQKKLIRDFSLEIINKRIAKEIKEKHRKNYFKAVHNKIFIDLLVLGLFLFQVMLSEEFLVNSVTTLNIISTCLKLSLQLIILISTVREKLNPVTLIIYCLANTFFAIISTSLSSTSTEMFRFIVQIECFHGWLIVLRYRASVCETAGYIIYFFMLKVYSVRSEGGTRELFLLIVPVFLIFKELKNQKNFLLEEIGNTMKIVNLKTQNEVMQYIPTGLSILDRECIHFHNDRIKMILGIRQAQNIFDRFDELKVEMNKIFVSNCLESKNLQYGNFMMKSCYDSETFRRQFIQENRERATIFLSNDEGRSGNTITLKEVIRKLTEFGKKVETKNFLIEDVAIGDRVCEIFINPVVYKNKTCFLLGIIDVSIKNHKTFLEDANLYKDKILAYTSHNLITPLNGIMNYLKAKDEESEGASCYKKIAIECAENLLDLTNNIKTFTEISNGELKIQKTAVNLKKVVLGIQEKFRYLCKKRGIQLEVDMDSIKDFVVFTSREKLIQIMTHVIKNSLKHTIKGYIRLKLEKPSPGVLKLNLKDTGVGIDPKQLEIINASVEDPLTMPINSGEEDRPLGLGLIICSHLTKILAPLKNDSPFLIKSEVDYGTEVTIYLDVKIGTMMSSLSHEQNFLKSVLMKKKSSIASNFDEDSKSSKVKSTTKGYSKMKKKGILNKKKSPSKKGIKKKNTKKKFESPYWMKMKKMDKMPTESMKKMERRNITNSKSHQSHEIHSSANKCDCYDILVVDDSDLILSFLVKFLNQEGNYSTKKAYNGKIALEKLASKCPEGHDYKHKCKVVITDINMPVINGRELAKIIKEKISNKEIPYMPIIANTANLVENKKDYKEFDDVFGKPVKRKEVLETVKRLIEKADKVRSASG